MAAAPDLVPRSAGAKPGDSGADVRRLQAYLTKFGYLESEEPARFGAVTDLAAPAPSKAGQFDDNTQQALVTFQERYGLEPSGVLDEATLDLMNKPRCGFPDSAEFVLQGNKWGTTNLRYGFVNFCADITQAQTRAAVQTALSYWSAVTPLTFTEVANSANPEIRISFVAGDHGDGATNAFDGPGSVLAHAYYPPPNGGDIAGDAHFDEAEGWSVNLPATGIDLYTVGAHEFGHSLGLAHSAVGAALMYPYYGGPHRHLDADDIAGIQALYGQQQLLSVTLDRIYATPHSANAWAHVPGHGWRKVKATSADGVMNTFAALASARAKNQPVTVQITATEIELTYV
jgi:peptidoglycan hydrolase-like protein with peptidoglycan-binding domain